MIENISSKELIFKILNWKKTFIWVTITTCIVMGVIVFLIPKQFKSTVVMFPARQFSVSKLIIEANAGNQEDYMMLGDADDCEKLIQVLTSDVLKLKVADAFNLWKRWKIKDTVFSYHYLKLKWEDMVSVKRTEFNSVKVEVHDYTANGAAQIANGIAAYVDSVKFEMNRTVASQVLNIVKEEYDNTLLRMKELEDSLHSLRLLGVLHFKEQVKAYSRSYGRAIEKNDVPAMKRLEAKLDTLKKYGTAYQNIHDNLEKYGAKYPDIKMKYDEALVNYSTIIPMKFIVEAAKPNEFKARPKRMIILAISILAANMMALFVLLIRERFSIGKA
jgi:hypothetical protein